jgi:hypothetical protein
MLNVFSDLNKTLRQQSSDVLNSTEYAIRESLDVLDQAVKQLTEQNMRQIQALKISLKFIWVNPLLIAISCLLGIYFVNWGLMQYMANTIQHQFQQKQTLAQEISLQSRALERLEAKTWGLTYHETQQGRFLILPVNAIAEPGWIMSDGKQAIKISSNQ